MSRSIVVYVEGGGPGGKTRKSFRMGMEAFLKSAVDPAGKRRGCLRVIPCGGRGETYDAFVDALKTEPECQNILLVDSEEAVADPGSPWRHLLNRKLDRWQPPAGVTDAQCHLMVVCMEAWFLADPDSLVKYFGSHFNRAVLPSPERSENFGENADAIKDLLTKAAKSTPKKVYKEIRDGAELLKKVKPEIVKKHCKWCDRLFNTLEHLITT